MIVINQETGGTRMAEGVTRKLLGHGQSLMMAEVGFEKGAVGEPHSHAEHEQVSYVVRGSFRVRLGDRETVLGPGDSFYAGKNVVHGVVALEDGALLDVFTPIRQEFLE